MTRKPDDETIVKYFLGELSEEEHLVISEAMFADDDLFNRMSAVKDDLIHEYALGEMPSSERARFEEFLRRHPDGAGDVELARALHQHLLEHPEESAVSAPSRGFMASLRKAGEWKGRPLIYVTALVLLCSFVSLPWLLYSRRLATSLRASEAERSFLEETRRREAEELRARNKELQDDLEREKQPQPEQEKPEVKTKIISPVLGAIVVRLSSSRDSASRTRLFIPSPTIRIGISFRTEVNYKSYRVFLQEENGSARPYDSNGLAPRSDGPEKSISIKVLATSLRNGDYKLTVVGVSDDGETELGYAYFIVVKK